MLSALHPHEGLRLARETLPAYSSRFSRKDYTQHQLFALLALGAGTRVGLFAATVVLLGAPGILSLLKAPPEVLPLAVPYLRLLAPVLLLEAYNLAMASILRAHLHVRDSLRVQVAMNATHLLLAPLLMRGLHGGGVGWDGLGLYGYALAMLASRVLGLVLHLRLWRLRMALVPAAGDWWRTPLDVLWPVLRIGLPGAAVEVVYRLAFMVSLASAARLGVAALATQAYTLQLLKYVLLVSMAIGWACEIMVGRLVGAGRFREADDLVNKGVRNGLLASGSLALMAALAAPWLMQAFTRDPAVIHSAQVLLGLSILLETGRVFNLILNGALRATGDALYPAVAAMASLVLVLGVGSLSLSLWLGLPGIWLAYAADEWLRGVLLLARWRWLGWIGHARSTRRRLRGSSAAAGD